MKRWLGRQPDSSSIPSAGSPFHTRLTPHLSIDPAKAAPSVPGAEPGGSRARTPESVYAALQGRLPAANAHGWPSRAVDPPSPGNLRTGSWTSGGDLQTGSWHFDLGSCNTAPPRPHGSLLPTARHRDRGEVRRHLRFGGFSQSAVALDLWRGEAAEKGRRGLVRL